jgi:DNA-binding SARP family transcriptional activator
VDVRILGALEAAIDGVPLDLGVRKARACFGVLALAVNTPVRTERIAEIVWPEGPPPRWDAALQSHVSRLRNALEPDRGPRGQSTRIETRGDAYVLHLADDEIDARRFERSAAEGRAALAGRDPESASTALGRALDEWRGPVLAGLGEGIEALPEVRRLDELRLVTITEHAEAEIALGRDAQVVAELETFVREHPLRERGWELLLLALYRSGRQAEALRRYQEVRAILIEELGIEPGPALRELEGEILRQEPALDRVAAPRDDLDRRPGHIVTPPVWLRPPNDIFVGRTSELASLGHALQDEAGTRRLVLVEGEPGIGKTRLVREACRDVTTQDRVLLGGRCVEEPLHVLQPFAEAITRLAIADGARLALRVPAEVGALAGLIPEFAQYTSPLPTVDADAHRYLFFRAVSNLLDADVVDGQVVLVLDDLQWAPFATLQLLAHVMRDDEHNGLLVIATVRDTEPTAALSAFVTDMERERRVQRIRLEGLDRDDVARLVTARTREARPDDMFVKTEGNPFYVEELVRHLDETGGALDREAVPDSVRDTIARRLLRLPDDSRRMLGIAAVAGPEFRLDVVAEVAGAPIDVADDTLGAALRAGVIDEHTGSVGRYRFSHALIQTVLRDGLGAARQLRVHRRIGEALEALGGDHGDIARHLLAAAADGSDPVPGVHAAMRAAARAMQRYVYDDAVVLLRTARERLLTSAASHPHLACSLEIALAEALSGVGDVEEREEVLDDAWQRALELADPALLADVVIEGCSTPGQPPAKWSERIEPIRARTSEDSRGRLMLTAVLSAEASHRPGERAYELAEWALARRDGFDHAARHWVLMHSVQGLQARSPIDRVVELHRATCDVARDAGDLVALMAATSQLRLSYLAAGDLVRSEEAARQYEELASATRIPSFLAGVEQRRAMREILAGRFAEGEAHSNQAYSLQPTPAYLEGVAVQLFAISYEQGRFDDIRPAVEMWASEYDRPAWRIGYGALLAEMSELEGAQAVIAPLVDAGLVEVVPPDDLFFLSLAAAGTTLVATRDAERAAHVFNLLVPHASRVIVAASGALCWGSIHRVLAPLAELLGNTEQAAFHFEAAMTMHERLGARPFLARDRLSYARMLRRVGGDPRRITELERTGLALVRALDMRSVLNRFGRLPA